ncbi:MAG: Crp/Fnr family transcriptional regulator [Telmatospirillum sp.]|nr:Crp/Fnr family transcriptional regulator [Telmatospirillum sp.]
MTAVAAELLHPPIVPWIESKNQEIWDKALHLGRKVVWKNKSVVQAPDDEVNSIYLIRQGVIKVAAASSEGLQRTLWLMGPGSILGEASLFSNRRNSHHISAMEECVAYEFSKQVVVGEILVRYPDLAEALLTNLANKSYIMSTQVEESAFLSVPQRLGRFLYGLCLARNSRHLPLSHAVIAELLGLHRVTVSNTVSALKRTGLLEDHTHEIVVADINALAAFLISDESPPVPSFRTR